MISVMDFLRWSPPAIYLRAKCQKWQTRHGSWLAGRVACMGQDVLKLLNVDIPMLNVQKGRIDYLLEGINNPRIKARTGQVAPYMERLDIIPLIAQQENFYWLKLKPPKALFMDSYAELTDQIFIHKKREWKFCCNYSDLHHDYEFNSLFIEAGLLPIEALLDYYRFFFTTVRTIFGNIPIIFLHYPSKLEQRDKFRIRCGGVLSAISMIAKEFPLFHSLTVDEGIVDWPEVKIPNLQDFPYHYNQCTYQALADQVRATGVFEALKTRSK